MSDIIRVPKGHYLFLQGDEANNMYIVKSGEIGLLVSNDSSEKMISTATAGQLIGEMALFDKMNRSASARALQDSEVVALPYRKLNEDLSNMPNWVQVVLKTLTMKIRQSNERYLNNPEKKMEET
ncbi:MAG: Crp/Fnr family transcriptional regulator [Pseudobdellovibrio sp.]